MCLLYKSLILFTKESEFVDFKFLFSTFETGIIPAKVPVTNASLQLTISSKVKSSSEQGILFKRQILIALSLVMPLIQHQK